MNCRKRCALLERVRFNAKATAACLIASMGHSWRMPKKRQKGRHRLHIAPLAEKTDRGDSVETPAERVSPSPDGLATDRQRSREAGFDRYLLKPVSTEEIQRVTASRFPGALRQARTPA